MTKEIGSYYLLENNYLLFNKKKYEWLPVEKEFSYTFSGRAAIELALKDIKSYKGINNVYMPSYCCQSMIQPFIDNGVQVDFYDVFYDDVKGLQYSIDIDKKCDVFFAMSYFGLEDYEMDHVSETFFNNNSIIVEDITHRLLTKKNHSNKAHYFIASIRKWFGIPSGGIVVKNLGELSEKPVNNSNHLVIKAINGMMEKERYLNGEGLDKSVFLNKLKESDSNFNEVDSTYKIDDTSLNIIKKVDIDAIRKIRVKNASYLYSELQELEGVNLLIKNPNWTHNVPLFVPIIVENNRNSLYQYLIENNVYCPIHWPNSEDRTNITDKVISLICDHRYSVKDMGFIVQLIKKWLGN